VLTPLVVIDRFLAESRPDDSPIGAMHSAIRGITTPYKPARIYYTSEALAKPPAMNGANLIRAFSLAFQPCLIPIRHVCTWLRILAPLPTTTPESAGLCALLLGSIVSLPLPISGRV